MKYTTVTSKTVGLLLAIGLMTPLASCQNEAEDTAPTDGTAPTEETTPTDGTSPETVPPEGGEGGEG